MIPTVQALRLPRSVVARFTVQAAERQRCSFDLKLPHLTV